MGWKPALLSQCNACSSTGLCIALPICSSSQSYFFLPKMWRSTYANAISTAMPHAVDLGVPLQIVHSWFAGSSSRGQQGG